MNKRIINPWDWQDQFGFVQANEITGGERILFCAGQVSVDSNGDPLHPGDMAAQINQAFDNLENVLNQAGVQFSDVVRLNYYTTDITAFSKAGSVIGNRLGKVGCRPVSTLLGVNSLFHKDILVELEATAIV